MSPSVASLPAKVSTGPPSPQSTMTVHGPSAPGSVKLPRSKLVLLPSSAAWSAGAVTNGARLATLTASVSESLPPSPSLTVTLTLWVAGPSAKVQSKLPAQVAESKLGLDSVPPSQVWASRLKASAPGSLTV